MRYSSWLLVFLVSNVSLAEHATDTASSAAASLAPLLSILGKSDACSPARGGLLPGESPPPLDGSDSQTTTPQQGGFELRRADNSRPFSATRPSGGSQSPNPTPTADIAGTLRSHGCLGCHSGGSAKQLIDSTGAVPSNVDRTKLGNALNGVAFGPEEMRRSIVRLKATLDSQPALRNALAQWASTTGRSPSPTATASR